MRSNFEFTGAQGCDRVHWQVRQREIATKYMRTIFQQRRNFVFAGVKDKHFFKSLIKANRATLVNLDHNLIRKEKIIN